MSIFDIDCTKCIDFKNCTVHSPFMPGCLQYDYTGVADEESNNITLDYVDGVPSMGDTLPTDTGCTPGGCIIIPFPVPAKR